MTSYSPQRVDTFAPIGATSQVSVTQATQAFALPSTSGAASPSLVIVGFQGNMQSLYVKFGTSVAVTVSRSDGMKVGPGSPSQPTILSIPTGSTHIAIICDGESGTIALTGADAQISSFAPNGASVDITVSATSATFAIPTPGTGSPAISLVGLQSTQISWFIKFGTVGVTVTRADGFKVSPGSATDIRVLAVPSGATHFAILCEGAEGSVRVTGGTLRAGVASGSITNAMLANMAESTIKGRAVGAGTGSPQDLTAAQATAILDVFTSVLKGLVPASGGGTTTFLRADGTFAAPGGGILQVLQTTYTTNAALSAQIPFDDTAPPLVSEGTEVLSLAITPANVNNRILAMVHVWGTLDNVVTFATAALFRGSTCINAALMGLIGSASEDRAQIAPPMTTLDSPASTSAQTYSVRVGPAGVTSLYLNGVVGARTLWGNIRVYTHTNGSQSIKEN